MAHYERPKNEEEFQKREAIGVIRASRFIRKFAGSEKLIDVLVINQIHKTIYKNAWPEIAGVFRGEPVKITYSSHLPPHHLDVQVWMMKFNDEIVEKIRKLKSLPMQFRGVKLSKKEQVMVRKIIHTAAWVHHKIVFIHPFVEGNGRTARLMANTILERFNLVGISIQIEKENKNGYRLALSQIDKVGDYRSLEKMIFDGLVSRYSEINRYK